MYTATMEGNARAAKSASSFEPTGGKLVLKHAYRAEAKVSSGTLYADYSGTMRTFGRRVLIRFYRPFFEAGLDDDASKRLSAIVLAGGIGDRAIDYGEVGADKPFLVLRPPEGVDVRTWWRRGRRGGKRLLRFAHALSERVQQLERALRPEIRLDRIFVSGAGTDASDIDLMCIGDCPTREEVHGMDGVLQRDLVLGFPPECFLGLPTGMPERTDSADVYRLCALLYELVRGVHPIFPANGDVASATATLMNDVRPKPERARTGSSALDALIVRGLDRNPTARPSWSALRAELAEAVGEEVSAEPEPEATPAPAQHPYRARRHRSWLAPALTLVGVFLGSISTFAWTNRPSDVADVVVSSSPQGVHFELIDTDGEAAAHLGRTPFVIRDVPMGSSLDIRPIYEDGTRGAVREVAPQRLEVLEACRALHVAFTPSE